MPTTGAASAYLIDKFNDHVLGGAAYTAPATLYVGLFTDTSTEPELDAGTLTNEVTGGSYARQTVTFGLSASQATENDVEVSFTDMPAVTVQRLAIMDAATAGNVLYHITLDDDITLTAGSTLTFAIGAIDISGA